MIVDRTDFHDWLEACGIKQTLGNDDLYVDEDENFWTWQDLEKDHLKEFQNEQSSTK